MDKTVSNLLKDELECQPQNFEIEVGSGSFADERLAMVLNDPRPNAQQIARLRQVEMKAHLEIKKSLEEGRQRLQQRHKALEKFKVEKYLYDRYGFVVIELDAAELHQSTSPEDLTKSEGSGKGQVSLDFNKNKNMRNGNVVARAISPIINSASDDAGDTSQMEKELEVLRLRLKKLGKVPTTPNDKKGGGTREKKCSIL